MPIQKLMDLRFRPGLVVVLVHCHIDVFSILGFSKWHSMMAFMEKIVGSTFFCTTIFKIFVQEIFNKDHTSLLLQAIFRSAKIV